MGILGAVGGGIASAAVEGPPPPRQRGYEITVKLDTVRLAIHQLRRDPSRPATACAVLALSRAGRRAVTTDGGGWQGGSLHRRQIEKPLDLTPARAMTSA